ncbi:DMT family transporter [Oceanibacterium hippocampi]|uniref:Riboflavin transporter n=1 Tax=Oceanibacterium hippocampi TaxID=745714 RepID=A0A1Y5T711_9PROT|nr:DMT family transporter [Oceanibacterium hippocampi]SLN57354.1 Riboflavin transporter [Oceanibacterium hippocampi]
MSIAVTTPVRPDDSGLRGVGFLLVAVCLFATMDACAKYLVLRYPIPEVIWVRYSVHTVLMLALFWPKMRGRLMRTTRPGLQIVRSVLLLVTTALFFSAVFYLPIADASAIAFVAPLIVVGLSVVILKEKVGVRRWAAVAVGFAGALVIIRPGLGAMHPAALLVLMMAVTHALYQITTRMLAGENPVTTLFYTAIVGSLAMSGAMPFYWVTPSLVDGGLMILLGVLGGVGHFLLIKAFQVSMASTLAPFMYLQLIAATIAGYIVFGDFPDQWTILGAAIVAFAGIYIGYRERVRRTPAKA